MSVRINIVVTGKGTKSEYYSTCGQKSDWNLDALEPNNLKLSRTELLIKLFLRWPTIVILVK